MQLPQVARHLVIALRCFLVHAYAGTPGAQRPSRPHRSHCWLPISFSHSGGGGGDDHGGGGGAAVHTMHVLPHHSRIRHWSQRLPRSPPGPRRVQKSAGTSRGDGPSITSSMHGGGAGGGGAVGGRGGGGDGWSGAPACAPPILHSPHEYGQSTRRTVGSYALHCARFLRQ